MGITNFVLHMYKQLSREQRYAIYLGIKEGNTISAIARQIVVSGQVQLASAKLLICLKNSVFGFEKLSFFLGRRFNFLPTLMMNWSEKSLKFDFLGMYCRMSLFSCSAAHFCQEQ